MDSGYLIDVDVEWIPGRGYAASYVIAAPDGAVIRRRVIARRFSAYSEAMGCALEAARATAATLPVVAGASACDAADATHPVPVPTGSQLTAGTFTGAPTP